MSTLSTCSPHNPTITKLQIIPHLKNQVQPIDRSVYPEQLAALFLSYIYITIYLLLHNRVLSVYCIYDLYIELTFYILHFYLQAWKKRQKSKKYPYAVFHFGLKISGTKSSRLFFIPLQQELWQ